MKKVLLLLFYIINLNLLYSQNLILNPDFEESTSNLYSGLKDWTKCVSSDSPDYFTDSTTNRIFEKYIGGIKSYSGNSHVGIFVYRNTTKKNRETREYIQVPLNQSLEKEKNYYVEVFIAADEESNIICSSLALYFSSEKLEFKSTSEMYKLNPQAFNPSNNFIQKNKWTKLSGNFTASGNEKYLIIGNFESDDNTRFKIARNNANERKLQKWNVTRKEHVAYFYIDNLSLFLLDPPKIRKNEGLYFGN